MTKVVGMIASVFFLGLTACAFGQPTNLFLGIGNAGQIADVNGLWDAMNDWPQWQPGNSQYRIGAAQTGPEILSDLQWLVDTAEPGDIAIFYYSGYGSRLADQNGDEVVPPALNTFDEAIVGHDEDFVLIREDAITAVLDSIASCVTLGAIFDASYSGGMTGGQTDLDSLDSVYVMMSSGEVKSSHGGTPYSVFTEALIAGIDDENNAAADANSDGTVTWDEWSGYAHNYVTTQYPDLQTPENYSGLLPACDRAPFVIPAPPALLLGLIGVGVVVLTRRVRRA